MTTTSNHMIAGGSNTVWGHGGMSSSTNVGTLNISLTCTSCHNPHGNAGTGNTPTYRLLKGGSTGNTPLFIGATTTAASWADVADDYSNTKYYIESANLGYSDNYFDVHSADTYASIAGWCAQCHTRYKAEVTGSPGSTSSDDAVFMYRHATNREDTNSCSSCHSMHGATNPPISPGCLSCHVAHGTGARMGMLSGGVAWPDGTTTPGGSARSSLLRLDNRGVCQQCHHK